MELSSLGAINTAISQGTTLNSSSKSTSGFAALFANLIGNESTTANNVSEQQQPTGLASDELAGLLTFLQKNDILELENGMELLDKVAFQSEANVINIIGEQLGLSSEKLLEMLTSFYNKLVSGKDGEELFDGMEQTQEKDTIEEILALMHAIAEIQKQNVNVQPDKDFVQVMRAIKLFELLSAQQDSLGNQVKLREFMKGIQEQLELKLNGSTTNRDEILQRTFSALVQEMNGKSTKANENNSENLANLQKRTETVHSQGFVHQQPLSRPEQLTLLANNSNKAVSAEELIRQFENILSRSHLTKAGGTQRLFIKLNPEHLGALRVELIQKDSAIIARILTSTSVAKEMMESHLNGLKQAFSSQNIQVERVEISQQFTQQERFFNREQQQEQGRQGKQPEDAQEQQTSDFTDSFEEALLNIEA